MAHAASHPEPAASQPGTNSKLSVFVGYVAWAESDELDAKIASWFATQGSRYQSSRLARFDTSQLMAEKEPGLRVFVTRVDPERLRIFFVLGENGTRRYLVRDVALASAGDEVGLENAAHVVFSSSLALWEGRAEMSLENVTAAASAVAPSPSPSPPRSSVASSAKRSSEPAESAGPAVAARAAPNKVHLVTALGYSLRYRNADSLLHGPRLGLGAARRWSSSGAEFGFGLSGTLLLPSTFEDAELTLELRGYSVAIEPWCDLVRLESLRVMAALGVGVDIVRASPSSSSTSVVASPASSNVDPSLAPRLGAYMTLGSVAVGAAFELNLALIRRRYDVREGDQSSPWFKSWYLQPGLLVQALWSGGP